MLARAPVVIVANAHDAARIAGLRHAPTRSIRGQLTLLPPGAAPSLELPVIGEGYAIPLPGGVTLTGATYELDDAQTSLRPAGHLENIERVAQMLPAFAKRCRARRCRGIGSCADRPRRIPLRDKRPHADDRQPRRRSARARDAQRLARCVAARSAARRRSLQRLCLRLARSRVGGAWRGTDRVADRRRAVGRSNAISPKTSTLRASCCGLCGKAASSVNYWRVRGAVIHRELWITTLFTGATRVEPLWT